MIDRTGRRVVFDRVAAEYDAMRPGYPEDAITFAVPVAPVDGGRLLEVGCGSGQATRSLLERGYRITAIDISPNLLTIARNHFGDRDNLTFLQTSFEEFSADRTDAYDVILAPSSWHWIDPEIGFQRASDLLRSGGLLSIMAHITPSPRRGFDQVVQSVYSRVVPEWTIRPETRTTSDVIRGFAVAMEGSGRFESVEAAEFLWTRTMERDEYLRLLGTYSDHRSLPDAQFRELCTGIGELIDREYGGRIEREFATFVCRGVNRSASGVRTRDSHTTIDHT